MVKGEVEICFDPRQKASSRRAPRDGRSDLELEMVNASAPPIARVKCLYIADNANTCSLIANIFRDTPRRHWMTTVYRLEKAVPKHRGPPPLCKPPPTLTTTAPPRHHLTRPDQQNTVVFCPDQHFRHLQLAVLPTLYRLLYRSKDCLARNQPSDSDPALRTTSRPEPLCTLETICSSTRTS